MLFFKSVFGAFALIIIAACAAGAAPHSNPSDQFNPESPAYRPALPRQAQNDTNPLHRFNSDKDEPSGHAVPGAAPPNQTSDPSDAIDPDRGGAVLAAPSDQSSATGVTIELARTADGTPVVGIKVEGEIMPGDTLKLRATYEKYSDAAVSTVFLRSKGGDVEEAMKMGRLIRTLRLETNAPSHFDSQLDKATFERSVVPATSKDNFVCASACFLVFAGGVNRSGDFLVLHRPYLSRDAARNLSDVGREAEQKQVMAEVRNYLQEMEVDQFFMDKMMWTSSQDGYLTTLADVLNHHLNGIVPSIEEIVLPSCDALTQHERDLFDKSTDVKLREHLGAKLLATSTCEGKQLDLLRGKAWARQHEHELQAKCAQFQLTPLEQQSLIAFFKQSLEQRSAIANASPGSSAPSLIADKQAIMQLLDKQDAMITCKSALLGNITIAAAKRYQEAWDKQAAATKKQSPEQSFDASRLSADEMVKKGGGAFKAKDYAEAMRWYRKAADLDNSFAMYEISKLYSSGSGVTRDDAEAMRWRNKAAERGDGTVIVSIGADYENGSDGVAQDYAEAMRWYRKAADLGNADAILSIGLFYDSGHGVAQDKAEAMRWFRKSADLGRSLAMYMIGVHYEYGDGVIQNDAEARVWMKKAAGLGDLAANLWLADNP
ncbi:MAG: hypothetical protein WAL80_11250 [Xanthobacteraceae bacterium]